ncbi:hypothetical protein [Mucilaginibacter auburnensis]|uniref:Tail length tape measure protein n=1 Tax=Mucilaginibacter auburnensis TaxID=1457233 RepID=A0A2H9VNP4_9SPHI|nr:hypothetical protein [Mucilaginibacter auburnensis]PJJ79965.1 hypothetical protein CLV57_3104 [Mucilaginibacter auburnensis]
MADNNKNISIDIEIDASGQQIINQYKTAFDSLRVSINSLSQPVNKLNGEISKLSGVVSDLGKQNGSLGESIVKIGENYTQLKLTFETVKAGIDALKAGALTLTTALTGGLSILLIFGPELISIISSFFKGKEAVAQMTDKLKGFNEIMKAANSDAATQTAKLNLLYKAATDVKNSDEARAESIRTLKNEYPDYFGKLTDEEIKNGRANSTYLKLTQTIIENARAKAALNKITEESAKVLDAEYKIQKINTAHAQEQHALDKQKQDLDKKAGRSGGYRLGNALQYIATEKKKSDERWEKSLAETQKIIDKADKSIEGYTKLGGGANKIASLAAQEDGKSDVNTVSLRVSTGKNKPKNPKPAVVDSNKTMGEPMQGLDFNQNKYFKESLDKNVQQDLDAQRNAAVKKVQISSTFDESKEQQKIEETEKSGHHTRALQMQIDLANQQYHIAIEAARKKGEDTTKIEESYAKKKAALEDQLTQSKIHAGDKFIDAAMKGSKKDSAIFKAAFLAKKATSIADTIISTKRAVMDSFKAYAGIPFIGQALGIAQAVFMGAQGAMSIAEIAKQKPGFAGGGRFRSDGKGALLSGYSRTDDTNAYLRSGEAVVVSEAMRNPWARNLVSAINVAYGGRDFSVANAGSGYAIGGIYTDGGNSNRYYSQPANDVKDLANTLAYQMINNFPPVYVDVKDINTQQSILAKTVERVNL